MKSVLSILPLGLLCLLAWLFLRWPGDVPAPAAVAKAPVSVKGPEPVADSELARYTPLGFDEIFRMPAGPEGFEKTEKLLSLEGGLVRMEGHMVKHPHDDHSVFLFTPQPMAMNQKEYGLADDLPPFTVHVRLENGPGTAPIFTGDKLIVLGRLETGPHEEVDGRISHIRLAADCVLRAADLTAVDLMAPVISQPERVRSGQGAAKS